MDFSSLMHEHSTIMIGLILVYLVFLLFITYSVNSDGKREFSPQRLTLLLVGFILLAGLTITSI